MLGWLSMIKLKDLLLERIVLDINVGDVILVGKFKNKKMVVKSIGKDKHGMPTINGRKATTFRMGPKSNLTYEVNERVDFHQMATDIVKKAGLNSKVIFKNTGKEKYKEKYEQEMNKAVDKGRDAHDGNYFEIKAEKYGRLMARKFLKKR